MAIYDIQSGEGGKSFIVRKDGEVWIAVAEFIPGQYTAEDENLLGAAGDAFEDGYTQGIIDAAKEVAKGQGPWSRNAAKRIRALRPPGAP